MPIKITSIKKENRSFQNPYEAISHLNWTDETSGEKGQHSRLEVYLWIKHDGVAYIEDSSGRKAKVVAAEKNGAKYLKTVSNEGKADLLLSLPEFY